MVQRGLDSILLKRQPAQVENIVQTIATEHLRLHITTTEMTKLLRANSMSIERNQNRDTSPISLLKGENLIIRADRVIDRNVVRTLENTHALLIHGISPEENISMRTLTNTLFRDLHQISSLEEKHLQTSGRMG